MVDYSPGVVSYRPAELIAEHTWGKRLRVIVRFPLHAIRFDLCCRCQSSRRSREPIFELLVKVLVSQHVQCRGKSDEYDGKCEEEEQRQACGKGHAVTPAPGQRRSRGRAPCES